MPRSKSGALKSRPRWAARTRIGNVWVMYGSTPQRRDPYTDMYLLFIRESSEYAQQSYLFMTAPIRSAGIAIHFMWDSFHRLASFRFQQLCILSSQFSSAFRFLRGIVIV